MPTQSIIILEDSINAATQDRITTFVINEFPKVLLAELNTHRVFSRNAASSRAIPLKRVINSIRLKPYIPYWTEKQSGMSGSDTLPESVKETLTTKWLEARDYSIDMAMRIHELGAAKQEVNRMLEPWMLVPVIVTGTEWENFFELRCAEDAQPDFAFIARAMRELLSGSEPNVLNVGEWHIPFSRGIEGKSPTELKKIATARCARVSYVNHDGDNANHDKDYRLHDRLLAEHHMSPFEHSAQALDTSFDKLTTNFKGFAQYRKFVERSLYNRFKLLN